MRSLTQALLYPGIGLLETTNLSVGRGTDTPFELVGAPWLNGRKLAAALNAAGLRGVRFVPLAFTPSTSRFADQLCQGVQTLITNRRTFDPMQTGLEFARQLRIQFPDDWTAEKWDRLLADPHTLQAVMAGRDRSEIRAGYGAELEAFRVRRARYLLYD